MASTTFKVDQAATYAAIAFVQAMPKTQFGTDQPDLTKDGVPKWSVELLVVPHAAPGRQAKSELLRVGIASHEDPGHGLAPMSPVHLVDFEVGVMDGRDGKAQVWFRASEVVSNAATGSKAA